MDNVENELDAFLDDVQNGTIPLVSIVLIAAVSPLLVSAIAFGFLIHSAKQAVVGVKLGIGDLKRNIRNGNI